MTDRPSRSSEFGRDVANVGRGRERGIVGRNEQHRKGTRDQQEREFGPLVTPEQAGGDAGESMRQSHDLPGVGNRPGTSGATSQSGARVSDAPVARHSTH